jgi:transposase
MAQLKHNELWRDFPKTATAFKARFATEEDCRAYWLQTRWSGKPACAQCKSTRVWTERDGFLFECADCGHQTSLTSGTPLEGTRKPFKVWFRAMFEISTHRTGISAKDLQRMMGFGSYKTAWTWLRKLRATLADPECEKIAKSKAEGKYKGRRPTARAKAKEVRKLLDQGVNQSEVARRLGIGRSSVLRIMKGPQ